MKSNHLFTTPNVFTRRDIKRRILFSQYEQERSLLKRERSNMNNSLLKRLNAQNLLNTLPGSTSFIKNRCMLSGRSRGIYRHFKLSRIMIKELASYGFLPGLRISSW